MPDWKIHTISVLLVYAVIFLLFSFSLEFGIMALLILLFSGLLPDLDHPRSLIRQLLGILCSLFISVIFFVSMAAGLEIRLASSVIMFLLVFLLFRKLPLRHRGRKSLHKWRIGIIISLFSILLLWFANLSIYLSLFILTGYWLHLGLDRVKYKG